MTRLSALLPVAQGVAIYAALRQHADATINHHTETRNRSQIMADTLIGRVTGQNITGCDPYGIPHHTKPHHHSTDRTQHPERQPGNNTYRPGTHTPADQDNANHTGGTDLSTSSAGDDTDTRSSQAGDATDTDTSPSGDDTDTGSGPANDAADFGTSQAGDARNIGESQASDAADLGTNGAHDGGRAATDDRTPADTRSADTNTASAEATSTGTDSTKVTGAAKGSSTDTAKLTGTGTDPAGDRPAGDNPAADLPDDGVSAAHNTRGAAVCATGTPQPPGLHLNLIMTDRTLLGDDNEPAHLIGHGPIPAALARSLVLGHADNPTTTWIRRLYTNPTGTQLLTCDAKQRIFPDTAKEFLIARDQICRTPWCDAPIRHLDHITPYAHGGPTTTNNGEGLCEACNYTKQAPDWHSTTDNDGAIHTTTPTGHTYTNTPPTPPKPSPWPDISTCETFLTHALLYVA